MMRQISGGGGVNACKTLARHKKTRSATRLIVASRFQLPLLGSNQDSPDPESTPAKLIFRHRITTPRVRVVRCRGEKPKCRGLSGLTWTETMTRKVCRFWVRRAQHPRLIFAPRARGCAVVYELEPLDIVAAPQRS